jgi:hypothetical protein
LATSRLPSFFNLIDFIKFVSIFMKGFKTILNPPSKRL